MDYKILLGLLTIAIGLVSYSFYFRDIFKGKTKPDGFSWLIWGFLASIIFFAQIVKGGGSGAWVTALTAFMCLLIATTTFLRGDGHIKVIDVISLVGATIGILLWKYTEDPLLAVILITAVDMIGFAPIFKKSFRNPHEETAITFSLNGLKFAVAFAALQAFNPVTWLYPVANVLMNTSLVIMLLSRRSALTNPQK
jgi:hypothetical protein